MVYAWPMAVVVALSLRLGSGQLVGVSDCAAGQQGDVRCRASGLGQALLQMDLVKKRVHHVAEDAGSSVVQLSHKHSLESTKAENGASWSEDDDEHALDHLNRSPQEIQRQRTEDYCDWFRLRFNNGNNHQYEGTQDRICVQPHVGYPYFGDGYCGIPGDEDLWKPTRQYSSLCRAGYYSQTDEGPSNKGDYFLVHTDGQDALLVDQIILQKCSYGTLRMNNWVNTCNNPVETALGADNDVGWCLSTDPDDHVDFGEKAYQSKCCASLKVYLDGTVISDC